jgi:hypothetical protein
MLLVLVVGKAQEKNSTTATQTKITMERPIITPEFEKLNLDDFKDGLVIKKDNLEVEPNKWEDVEMYSYNILDDKGRRILNGSYLGGFGVSFVAKDSYYLIGKMYSKNSMVETKYIASSIKKSIKIGKQYFFDQDGKLEKTIDYDLGWDYSYEKVIEYILDRKAPLEREDIYWGAEIAQEGTAKKYWKLVLDTRKTTNKSTWELIKLDAMTGEILSQIEYEGGRIYYPCMGDNNPPLKQRIIVADKTLGKEKK